MGNGKGYLFGLLSLGIRFLHLVLAALVTSLPTAPQSPEIGGEMWTCSGHFL